MTCAADSWVDSLPSEKRLLAAARLRVNDLAVAIPTIAIVVSLSTGK